MNETGICDICHGSGELGDIVCPQCDGYGKFDWIHEIVGPPKRNLSKIQNLRSIQQIHKCLEEFCNRQRINFRCSYSEENLRNKVLYYLQNVEGITRIVTAIEFSRNTFMNHLRTEFNYYDRRYAFEVCLHPRI